MKSNYIFLLRYLFLPLHCMDMFQCSTADSHTVTIFICLVLIRDLHQLIVQDKTGSNLNTVQMLNFKKFKKVTRQKNDLSY